MSKQALREGPMGKETIGERGNARLCVSGACPLPVYAYSIAHLFGFVKGFSEKSLGFLKVFREGERL